MDFISLFQTKIAERDISWEVSALASAEGKLYSLGSDSKLIGRIFELISYSIIQEIADENDYILKPAKSQTSYPDFTLMKDEEDKQKIAIDIKTTYRDFYKKTGEPKGYIFTLGSYASFMRDGKKNISYPYSEYSSHFVVGFIYTRNEDADEGRVYELDKLRELQVPYKDVDYFVQEKYKIAGEKPGSGNTENIGSYKTNKMDYLINGEGPFSQLGMEFFEKYWSGYPKFRSEKKDYTTIDEYFTFLEKKGEDTTINKRLYTYWKTQHVKTKEGEK